MLLHRVVAIIGGEMLSRRQHAHTHILLMCLLNGLLLLLKKLYLLLDSHLLHWESTVSIVIQ